MHLQVSDDTAIYDQTKENLQATDLLIDSLLKSQPDKFSVFYNSPATYRMQIIYTEVIHENNGEVRFVPHTYRVNKDEYFNPASLVKFPLMLMTLDKLNSMKDKSIDKFTSISIEKNHACQKEAVIDTTSPSGLPNMANYIAKILLYSDNDAYNRLYEFLGQQYIAEQLKKWGMNDAKVVHRFDRNCDGDKNQYTNAFNFFDKDSNLLYRQPPQYNEDYSPSTNPIVIGVNEDVKGKLTGKGKDFANSNCLPLQDINDLVIGMFYPEKTPYYNHINLTENDRKFIIRHMGTYPRESDYTMIYDTVELHDSYKKYLVYGQKQKYISDNSLRIYNMVGQSYGFLTDVAYIVDYKNNRDFFLSATIYVNSNGIINDGKYEYTKTGFPYLKNLGLLFLNHERKKSPADKKHLDIWQEYMNTPTMP